MGLRPQLKGLALTPSVGQEAANHIREVDQDIMVSVGAVTRLLGNNVRLLRDKRRQELADPQEAPSSDCTLDFCSYDYRRVKQEVQMLTKVSDKVPSVRVATRAPAGPCTLFHTGSPAVNTLEAASSTASVICLCDCHPSE